MNFNFYFYWKLLLRRLPAMMALFLLCTGIGLALAIRLPTLYQTSARLLVEEPQIPDTTTVQTNATEQIEVTRQQLMTRANLLEIARKLHVFPDIDRMSPDAIVNGMQSATRIVATGGGRRDIGQPTIVTVSFSAARPQTTADVVNEYVTRIVNANSELRTSRAEGTFDFFQQEVDRLDGELQRASAKIAQFQSAHAGALPDDLAFRQNRQSLLQERIASAGREKLGLAEQRKRTIEVYQATGQVNGAATATMPPDQRQLMELQGQLDTARSVYSETSPQVTMLKARIEQLQQRVAAAGGGEVSGTGSSLLDIQLAQIDAQIAALDDQIKENTKALDQVTETIAATPANAIVLGSLQRDYENMRQQYDQAVQRRAQASVGERIEATARGQKITLIEGANVPQQPYSPNRPRVAAMGAAAGLALAGGLFMLLELLNRAVRIPSEVTKGLGIVPLATIPYIESRSRKLFRRSLRVASLVVVVVGIPAVLWAVDTYYLPLDLLATKIMARLGLA